MSLLSTVLLVSTMAASSDVVVPYDHHVHFRSPAMYAMLKRFGLPMERPEEEYTDAGALLRANAAGKSFLVSLAYLYAGFGLGEKEYDTVKAENDNLAEAVSEFPGRLYGFYSVNPLRDYAKEEVLRCFEKPGLHGLKLHFDNSKVDLRNAEHLAVIRELLQLAAEKRIPVLIHLDNHSDEYGEKDAQIFVDELLSKVPPLEIYIAHLGAGGGYDSSTSDVLAVFERALKVRPEISRHQLYFDISGIVFAEEFRTVKPLTDEQAIELSDTLRRMGLKRFVFGTDYSVTDAKTYLELIRARLTLTSAELQVILDNTGPLMGSK